MIGKDRRARWRALGFVLCALPVFALIWTIGDTFIEDDNFRVVNADVYRAGQLRSDEWRDSYAEHPYRSVLNLRGGKDGDAWYDGERGFASEHGLTHYDVPLSANVRPTLDQMEKLVGLMRAAPKPLLIHCKDGADRSGLVAALYLYAVDGASAAEASGQLSLWYGHFPWLTSRTGAMDDALASFVARHPKS